MTTSACSNRWTASSCGTGRPATSIAGDTFVLMFLSQKR
jgi:hypothetical protein